MPATEILKPEIFEALNFVDFIALDIETTGLDYQAEEIIEFAAVHFHNGEIVDSVDFLIKPFKNIPPYITRITGLRDKDVAGASSFAEMLPKIRDFVKGYPLLSLIHI